MSSMIPYERLQPGQPPTVAEAASTLVGDFYASFKFAQGETSVQRTMFQALSTTYSKLWTPQVMQAIAHEAVEAAQDAAEGIKPRRVHPFSGV